MNAENIKAEYYKLIDQYYDVMSSDSPQKEHLATILNLVKNMSIELYDISKKENLHWPFCSSRTYANTYKERLNRYLDINDDEGKSEVDFVESELRHINFQLKSDYINFIDKLISKKIIDESEKTILFLDSIIKNEHPPQKNKINVFTSDKAEELFNRLWENYLDDKKRILTNISFIYRVMYSDGFINSYVRPEIFRKEIDKAPYNIETSYSLKNLNKVNQKHRLNLYKEIKELVFKNS
jgi:hypothetical protein